MAHVNYDTIRSADGTYANRGVMQTTHTADDEHVNNEAGAADTTDSEEDDPDVHHRRRQTQTLPQSGRHSPALGSGDTRTRAVDTAMRPTMTREVGILPPASVSEVAGMNTIADEQYTSLKSEVQRMRQDQKHMMDMN